MSTLDKDRLELDEARVDLACEAATAISGVRFKRGIMRAALRAYLDSGPERAAGEMLEALQPFTGFASEHYLKTAPDDGLCASVSYTAGQYRAVRSAIALAEARQP